MLDANLAQSGATIFLGVVGLWLAYNYRRQVRLKLADWQVDAYMTLWKISAVAAHTRTTPLDQAERQKLYNEMERANGNRTRMTSSEDRLGHIGAALHAASSTGHLPPVRP